MGDAIGTPGALLGATEMEAGVPRIADWPAAFARLDVRHGLDFSCLGCHLTLRTKAFELSPKCHACDIASRIAAMQYNIAATQRRTLPELELPELELRGPELRGPPIRAVLAVGDLDPAVIVRDDVVHDVELARTGTRLPPNFDQLSIRSGW